MYSNIHIHIFLLHLYILICMKFSYTTSEQVFMYAQLYHSPTRHNYTHQAIKETVAPLCGNNVVDRISQGRALTWGSTRKLPKGGIVQVPYQQPREEIPQLPLKMILRTHGEPSNPTWEPKSVDFGLRICTKSHRQT